MTHADYLLAYLIQLLPLLNNQILSLLVLPVPQFAVQWKPKWVKFWIYATSHKQMLILSTLVVEA
jgi:hypothetical protein